jgi:hypothetical protein
VIEDNRVSGEDYYGILVVTNVDQNVWEPYGNMVKENVVTDSGVADLALAAPSADNNCFSGNTSHALHHRSCSIHTHADHC